MNFIQSVRADQFERVDFTFFAFDPRSTRAGWKAARDHGNTIIDLTDSLAAEPGATVRSPWIERETGQPVVPELQPGPVVVAHPAAVVLALLVARPENREGSNVSSPPFMNQLPNTGRRVWTNSTSRPLTCFPFRICPRTFSTFRSRSTWSRATVRIPNSSLAAATERVRTHYRQIAPGIVGTVLNYVQSPDISWLRVFHLRRIGPVSGSRRRSPKLFPANMSS